MLPHFVASPQSLPAAALVVDGFMPGAAATYSHWKGAPEAPAALRADTSTQMLLQAACDPKRWLEPYTIACNDHVDADGLLATAIACNPDLGLAHASLLIHTAEAGDFSAWSGEEALRMLLAIHQYIRAAHQRGDAWQSRAYQDFPAALPLLIQQHREHDAERDAQIATIISARSRLLAAEEVRITATRTLTTIAWQKRHGIGRDTPTLVHQDEDYPLWSFDAIAPTNSFQLLAMCQAGGTVYRLDAPRHSWALTVKRSPVTWPDAERLRALLQARESGPCHWVCKPAASAFGFVCLLASSNGSGELAPSRLSEEAMRHCCQEALDRIGLSAQSEPDVFAEPA
jgi:hypothetical protein